VANSVPLNTLLARASNAFTSEYEQRLALAGYGDISFAAATNVLRLLGEDVVQVGVLVAKSGVTKQAISQQLSHLTAHGYVRLEPDPADSRAKLVRLTDKGRRCQDVAGPLHETVERDWRRRFGRDEIGHLRISLEHIIDRLAAGR
jgi:DNA-binding MarR family transcriptional regulator